MIVLIIIAAFIICSWFSYKWAEPWYMALVSVYLRGYHRITHDAIYIWMPDPPPDDHPEGTEELRIERNAIPIFSVWTIEGVGKVRRGTRLHKQLQKTYKTLHR